MEILTPPDARAFLDVAEPFLAAEPLEHQLVLALSRALAAVDDPADAHMGATGGAPFFAVARDAGEVRGILFRTPPRKGIVGAVDEDTATQLVRTLAAQAPDAPGVFSRVALSEVCRHAWQDATGVALHAGRGMRLHVLDAVDAPPWPVAGHMRLATEEDVSTLVAWTDAFAEEIREAGPGDALAAARDGVAKKQFVLWEVDGEAVSMSACKRKSSGLACVNYVYTPPALRGRGYATALVAAQSQMLLDQGNAQCCLYTDLANPTSNHIYHLVGYRPVMDLEDSLTAEALAEMG